MAWFLRMLCGLWVLSGTACAQEPEARLRPPPPAPREFRAAWIATVDNIDWPSRRDLPAPAQRAELDALLDRARTLRLNAVILQVRPACDALYAGSAEPWSEYLTGAQGRPPAPLWDPLQYAIDGARARGLELHAWFNPFRARHRSARSPAADNHVSQVAGLCVRYGAELWLDPGLPAARAHSLAVIHDVVDRYDIDGVHLDDYFYPYPAGGEPFPDDASYQRYRAEGGRLRRADWRRHNVDTLIEALYTEIKRRKPWVKFGISPFGIARPGVPAGIEAGIDQFDDLYADVRKWLDRGWCDYLAPQLYWPIDQRPQSYPVLLDWWIDQNPRRRHLWIGNFASAVQRASKPWKPDEIVAQIRLTRERRGATGNIHFSLRALDPRQALGRALRDGPYFEPALVPASTWLDADPPAAPALQLSKAASGALELRWPPDADARWRAVYLLTRGRWRLVEVLPGASPGMRLTAENLRDLRIGAVAVAAVDRCGNESERVVRAVP